MPITLYNTLTKKEEEFKPIQEGKAGIYSCGPTVYGYAHIGNLRSFIFADILRRVLELDDFNVTQVMNITDVGHLTDDADAGEDKMIVAMRREGKSAYDIAAFYTDAFMKDIERLNIKPANAYPKATEHIQEQIKMVEDLEKNGFAYKTSDGIYFDTSKLESYGKLSGQKGEEKKAGARVDIGEKRNATDFALWKFSKAGEKREMEWDSPWGKGFPGWHLECSAMSIKYLGVPFDIHTGGVDHIPVHHENEIAQTEGTYGKPQANYWMHGEFLTVEGGKMSKSLGNLYTPQDLIDKGFDPLAFRYLVLGAHYRTKLNFTWEALEGAQNALYKLYDTVREWDQPTLACEQYGERFFEAVNHDLNTPQALALVWEIVDNKELPSSEKSACLLMFDQVFGLKLDQYIAKPIQAPPDVLKLVQEREDARIAKDFEASDRIRNEIEQLGFTVEDTAEGPNIREKR